MKLGCEEQQSRASFISNCMLRFALNETHLGICVLLLLATDHAAVRGPRMHGGSGVLREGGLKGEGLKRDLVKSYGSCEGALDPADGSSWILPSCFPT